MIREILNEETSLENMEKLATSLLKGTKMLRAEYKKQRNDKPNKIAEFEKELLKTVDDYKRLLK